MLRPAAGLRRDLGCKAGVNASARRAPRLVAHEGAADAPGCRGGLHGPEPVKVLGFARGRSRGGRRGDGRPRPGSQGEHILQERYGTGERAGQFYDNQFSDQLTPKMIEFIGRMEMAFIATSDAAGECDCSFRAGTAGFLRVLDERTVAYPEFRGNGVMASLGNVLENPHIGIL